MSTTPLYNSFASDNTSSVCPEVMDAIIAANSGVASSYGDDQLSKDLNQTFSDLFEKEVVVFPVMSGTASNALALSALVPSYGKVSIPTSAQRLNSSPAGPSWCL
jgi:threonine aldolase